MNDANPNSIFIVSHDGKVVGIRTDQILSFTYNESAPSLIIRYIGNTEPERFEGSMADALLRELRYIGRN